MPVWPAKDDTRRAVLARLAALDEVADKADPSTLLPLARTELRRLADGWRRLLTAHQAGPDGRCEACRTRIRARRWPCQVWRAAHEQLIGDGVPHRQRTYPLRNPFTRQNSR
ncbi:hypothetical protein [Actinophytocola algeriensis]|jgi:hypothetical protein|uniref:Uncharacterized protein n=1 Tax=Actinophytocola algeriensis TaxID=1768010 RepID=A0A7W7PZ74_9PSEU|nr:hypothetical protein [Actinophytocola algeriensis]MBB4904029.1 hypothetical protein [Actinophytocola algeriensis]MBE1477114.1 hypothetical protein [Actinophytocola algeriensis]